MKRLNSFLEGLLNKSNKTDVVDTKEFLISAIEDRIRSPRSNFNERMPEILDLLKNTYTRASAAKIKITTKPQCFIRVHEDYDRSIASLGFMWIQARGKNTYYYVRWGFGNKGLYFDSLGVGFYKEDTCDLFKKGVISCYEVPEEDMKEYFRAINNLTPIPSYYNENEKMIIKQVIR
jgi:hypothetical protein